MNWINEGRWYRGKKNKTWLIKTVRFEDTRGTWHYSGTCAFPAMSVLDLIGYHRKLLPNYIRYSSENPRFKAVLAAITEDRQLFDDQGEWLPEFDPQSWKAYTG